MTRGKGSIEPAAVHLDDEDDWPLPLTDYVAYVPADFRELFLKLVALTDEFCSERLNAEYLEMCRGMAVAVCQPGSPVVRGKPESWACGIAYTVGWVNFLGDASFEPTMRSEEIAQWFGVSAGTMQSKSKAIREGLDLMVCDPRFTVESMLEHNPLVWMVELDNGLIVDVRHGPRELQEAAYEAGLIPYVPEQEPGDDEEREE